MPIFEGTCQSTDCSRSGELFEYLLKNADSQDPACPGCGNSVIRQWSMAGICWAKDLGQYNGRNDEGHFATYRDENNAVQKKFIRTRQEQKEFCRQHGFHSPEDLDNDPGSALNGVKTTGQKGTWI